MNTLFDFKSYRVKGISFHPKNSWVLTSLHNGEICLYDYVNGLLLEKFTEHEGPVRSVQFHNMQPMFVSGGDDCKIKVWNYNLKKCIYNLTGHTDYIRTVQFHHELPWILSSSDDATIRIWNFQNRTLLTTAAGHEHYVMSAFFHPSQDLIVSASLDQSIRIWDYSVLRKKFFEARSNTLEVISMDVTVKFKIDGHDRGVNWAIFHPTLNLIASGSDDKTVKIWKYADNKWSEADTLRGHHNNVSSVAFHQKYDYLISNSEDKSIRIWDLTKKTTVDKITKENDRFWVLASHPTLNIFASGSDSGLTVFNIENTRIPCSNINNTIILYQNKTIKLWKFGETEKKKLCDVKINKDLRHGIGSIVLNPFINIQQNFNFAFVCDENNHSKKLLYFYGKNEGTNTKLKEEKLDNINSVCFISSNKFLTLSANGNLVGYDTNNINNKFTIDLPLLTKDKFENIYQGPLGKFLIKFKNGIVGLLDANTKKIIQETNEITDLKFVLWNNNLSLGTMVGEKTIFIINKNMDILHKIKENSKVKSVCFDENNILFYTTDFHIKYSLQNGLGGIIKSIELPYYLMMVQNGTFYLSDALQNLKTENFNYTPCRFKISLFNKNYDDIVNILRSGAISGIKAIENIQNSGFPDLSLKFVNDPKQKFYLALQSGKLEEASAAADLLKDKLYYDKLAEKAMLIGKLNVAEVCYVKSENLDKLIFFYVLTGRQDKLKVLEELLQKKGENSRRFLNTIYTANYTERINILNETGQNTLASITAKIHNREDLIRNNVNLNKNDVDEIITNARAQVALKPIFSIKNKEYHSNWVTNTEIKRIQQSNIDNILSQNEETEITVNEIADNSGFNFEKQQVHDHKQDKKKVDTSKWKDDEDEEEDEEIKKILESKANQPVTNTYSLTIKDEDYVLRQYTGSTVPGIQLLLGNIKLVFSYLKSQLGIVNYEPLKLIMKDIYMSSYSQLQIIPVIQPNELIIRKTVNEKIIPLNGISLKYLQEMLNFSFQEFTDRNLDSALKTFRNIIKSCLFFISSDIHEETKVKEIISICTEYIYLIRLTLASEDNKSDKVKYAELNCLMTVCKLENSLHRFLILKKAKAVCKNIKNYITGINFLKKMISLEKELTPIFNDDNPFPNIHNEFEAFSKLGTNQHNLCFNINENLPHIRSFYCSKTFNRMDKTSFLECPLDYSVCSSQFKGQICETCNLTKLGEQTLGLKLTL